MEENQREAKQVLIVRKDLNMRKGKIAAQCAHASMKVLLDRMDAQTFAGNDDAYIERAFSCNVNSALAFWLHSGFAKICVYVNSEEELFALEQKAMEAGLPSAMIVDSGRTEFHGVATRTVLAIGPAWSDEIDPITRHLPLL